MTVERIFGNDGELRKIGRYNDLLYDYKLSLIEPHVV
jgi:hypothetical protein